MQQVHRTINLVAGQSFAATIPLVPEPGGGHMTQRSPEPRGGPHDAASPESLAEKPSPGCADPSRGKSPVIE
ncbi:MAG: hypothetical protein KatS3mg111_3062 [Pirellulaceae bacterium]|nr:MAG: hypothetical protein KatS3mg111_3062 [Pirellulaceae bacterium]